jgi:two-component system OmpR family sensor kinase
MTGGGIWRGRNLSPRSLRGQLALTLAGVVMLVWLLVVGATALAVRHELDEVSDSAQRELAGRLLSLSVAQLAIGGPPLALPQHPTFLNYVVRGADGRIVLRSQDGVDALFAGGPVEGFRDANRQRIFSLRVGDVVVEVAEPLSERREAVREAVVALVLPLLVLVPLSLIAVVVVVARAMRPVDRLRAEVTARGGGDLRPVAVAGLATEVNAMLARLTRTLEAERDFTANAAHEVRTPIAAALAQTQRMTAEAPPGPLADRARGIEAELLRLARLSEKLMQLARAEGGDIAAGLVDVAPYVQAVVEDFRRAGGADRLVLDCPAGPVLARIDPEALAILLRNLIENAVRHGDPDATVEVALRAGGAVRVVNAGPVVPPGVLSRLTRRFERGMATSQGAGLGLAIADVIARGAGGRLVLRSPAAGRSDGFEAAFEVALEPAAGAVAD